MAIITPAPAVKPMTSAERQLYQPDHEREGQRQFDILRRTRQRPR
jgi:hypothetical protein